MQKLIKTFSILLLSTTMTLVACQKNVAKRHQQASAEDVVIDETSKPLQSLLSSDHQSLITDINRLIEEDSYASHEKALQILENYLFALPSQDPELYRSQNYSDFLRLYVKLYQANMNSIHQPDYQKAWQQSLKKFDHQYLSPCIDNQPGDCERLKTSLNKEKNLVLPILAISSTEPSLPRKINLLGYAFDLSKGRSEKTLTSVYLDSLIAFFKKDHISPVNDFDITRHRQNFLNILSINPWKSVNAQNIKLFMTLKPWSTKSDFSIDISKIHDQLKAYIPLYSEESREITRAIKTFTVEKIKEKINSSAKLSTYPAYSNIDPYQTLSNISAESAYLFYAIYFDNIDNRISSQYLRNSLDPKQTLKELSLLSHQMVRWDIASLSIESTQKLANEFGKYDVKTTDAFMNTLAYSQKITQKWAEFHNGRKSNLEKSILANHDLMTEDQYQYELKFFQSLDRNIMKTAIYPNMLAFMYHLSKSEWSRQIKFLKWTFDIDTTDLFTDFFSGSYQTPWFNFLNLNDSNKSSWSPEKKSTLYRHEIIDSFYYFLSTKTFEEYKIPIDDMMYRLSENLIRTRKNIFERVLEQQNLYILNKQSPTYKWSQWCQDIKNNRAPEENLDFYSLHSQILPFSHNLYAFEAKESLRNFYADDYGLSEGFINARDVLDRFRSEYLPLVRLLSQLQRILSRLHKTHPKLNIANNPNFNSYLQNLITFKQSYWGQQRKIESLVSDCALISAQEARKRAREVAYSENSYLRELVYPIFKQLIGNEITIDQANQKLADLDINGRGFRDHFIKHSEDRYSYYIDAQSFFLRVAKYLEHGLKQGNQPLTQAIVGPHLHVNIDSHFMTDLKNPYGDKSNSRIFERIVPLYSNSTADQFVKATLPLLTDNVAASNNYSRFSSWDKKEAKTYLLDLSARFDYFVQRYRMQGEKYLNLSDSRCQQDQTPWPPSCYLTESFSLSDMAQEIDKVFKTIELDEEMLNYFNLINARGYLYRFDLGMILEKSSVATQGGGGNWLPYTQASGFFDLAFEMLTSDTLGMTFNNGVIYFENTQISGNGQNIPMYTCGNSRNGCPWGNDRSRALELFYARKHRPGLIFNFDIQILRDQYQVVKRDLERFYKGPLEIYQDGQAILDQIRPNKDYRVSRLDEKPLTIRALRVRNKDYQVDIDKFLKEKTESYFLRQPDWSQYLLTQDH